MEKRPDLWPERDPVEMGQESVWDFPRPPRVELVGVDIRVEFAGGVIGESRKTLRVLETSLPPGYYLPPEDIDMKLLVSTRHRTMCEWKGETFYYDVAVLGRRVELAAWGYPDPVASFAELKDYVSFYPARVDCFVGGEKALAQEGVFYGGWITSHVAGPFKGAPGSEQW